MASSEPPSVVDRLLAVDDYDDRLREYFSTARKQATLETEKPRSRLAESEEYTELVDRRKQLQTEVDDRIAEMDPDQVTTVLRQLPGEEDDGALE